MSYKFATENINYEDYSSGRVLYNQHGTTAFPVRLASEIFQRCVQILKQQAKCGPYTVYDPCCGGAFLLTSLGLLFPEDIDCIYASDIDENVLQLADKNLSLLSDSGLNRRISQLTALFQEFGKESHREALESANRMREQRRNNPVKIEIHSFQADAAKMEHQNHMKNIDMVITDLPYGEVVSWSHNGDEKDAAELLLENLLPQLSSKAVAAVVANKKIKSSFTNYKKVDSFKLGKRYITILQKEI